MKGNIREKAAYAGMAVVIITELILFTLLSFRGPAEKESKRKLAVSVVGPTHLWTIGVEEKAGAEVKRIAEEKNWDYAFCEAVSSGEQSRQILEILDEGMDCLVLLPMDGASLKTAAVIVQQSDVPVVIFDREIPDFAPAATVKGDNYGIGRETALHFNKRFPNGTTVLEIMGDTSTVPYLRMSGYNDHIQKNIETVEIGYAGWQRDTSREIFRRWVADADVREIEKVGAIFTHDDEIALGVLDVLDGYARAHNGEKLLPNLSVIAGSSNSQEFYRRIKKETQYELFSMRYAPDMVENAIQTAADIIEGNEYEDLVIIPTEEVNKSNVDKYLE